MTINDPTLEVLSPGTLQLDAYTQRTWDPKWSKAIADDFDWDKVGVFRVSRRAGGDLYVMDGQHRLHAVRTVDPQGNEDVLALVYEGLTTEEEAELYLAFNVKTRKANSVDTFRLETVAHEREAVDIQQVLDRHGLVVAWGAGSNVVSAVQALRWIYRQGGTDLLEATLNTVENAWGVKDRWARDGNILKGVAQVIHKVKDVDRASLADKLGRNGRPGQLLGTARTYRTATRRSLWLETAHQVVSVYNHGRSSRRVSL